MDKELDELVKEGEKRHKTENRKNHKGFNTLRPRATGKFVGKFKQQRHASGAHGKKLAYNRKKLTDADVAKLKEQQQESLPFTELDFSENELSAEGLKSVLSICLKCEGLRVVKLYKNNIDDEGADSLVQLCERFPRLEELHLSHNSLSGDGTKRLLRAAAGARPENASPLWVRMELNSVDDPWQVLSDLRGEGLKICERKDKKRCTVKTCIEKSTVHVPFFERQRGVVAQRVVLTANKTTSHDEPYAEDPAGSRSRSGGAGAFEEDGYDDDDEALEPKEAVLSRRVTVFQRERQSNGARTEVHLTSNVGRLQKVLDRARRHKDVREAAKAVTADTRAGREPRGREPRGREPRGREPRGREPRGREPRGREPRGREPRGAKRPHDSRQPPQVRGDERRPIARRPMREDAAAPRRREVRRHVETRRVPPMREDSRTRVGGRAENALAEEEEDLVSHCSEYESVEPEPVPAPAPPPRARKKRRVEESDPEVPPGVLSKSAPSRRPGPPGALDSLPAAMPSRGAPAPPPQAARERPRRERRAEALARPASRSAGAMQPPPSGRAPARRAARAAAVEVAVVNNGQKLGIGFNPETFEVMKIKEDGLVWQFNKASPDVQIEVGDILLEANGTRLRIAEQYHKIISQSRVARLTFAKKAAAPGGPPRPTSKPITKAEISSDEGSCEEYEYYESGQDEAGVPPGQHAARPAAAAGWSYPTQYD